MTRLCDLEWQRAYNIHRGGVRQPKTLDHLQAFAGRGISSPRARLFSLCFLRFTARRVRQQVGRAYDNSASPLVAPRERCAGARYGCS